jgi:hypothetical protein
MVSSRTEKDDFVAADVQSLQSPAAPRSGPRKRCERHIPNVMFMKTSRGLRELITVVTAACRADEKCETHSYWSANHHPSHNGNAPATPRDSPNIAHHGLQPNERGWLKGKNKAHWKYAVEREAVFDGKRTPAARDRTPIVR